VNQIKNNFFFIKAIYQSADFILIQLMKPREIIIHPIQGSGKLPIFMYLAFL